jgi:tetratricopeptide (TPR) repeat protein
MPYRASPAFRTAARTLAALALAAGVAGCVPHVGKGPGPAGPPEARSLLGQPLYAPELPLETRQRLEAQLDSARLVYEAHPDNPEAILWYGRRLGYLGEYRAAVDLFTEGVHKYPRDARFYRHRGHRLITLRRLGQAVSDLERAARLTRGRPDQVEPDGQPNAAGVPLTTLQGNIYYHLGLAYYLRGAFLPAAAAFRTALGLARNDESRVAAADWLYSSLRRAGRTDEAQAVLEPFGPGLTLRENEVYYRRLLLYKGLVPPDSLLDANGRNGVDAVTLAYGVANWHLFNGRRDEAEQILLRITQGENWAPFGYIAAEADLRRLMRTRRPAR